MGITNRLQPDEVTNLCNTAAEPNDKTDADGLADIDHFARFMRASEAPARDVTLSQTPEAKNGETLFDKSAAPLVTSQRSLPLLPALPLTAATLLFQPRSATKRFILTGTF